MSFTETFYEYNQTLVVDGTGEALGPLTKEKTRTVYIICLGEFTTLPYRCFYQYSSAISISIPESIRYFEDNVIEGCESLTSFTMTKNVEKISDVQSFDWCYSIQNIFVDPQNQYFRDIDGVLYSKDAKSLWFHPGGRTEKVFNIPYGVETIKLAAIAHSNNLNTLIVPPTIRAIEMYFAYCSHTIENIIINQCRKKINFNTVFMLDGTTKNESIIQFSDRCIYIAKTCIPKNKRKHDVALLSLVNILLSVYT